MIAPRLQWAHQIVVTSLCWPHTGLGTDKRGPLTACSNCTRMLGHEQKRFYMTPEQFRLCVEVARDFVYESPPCPQGRIHKVIGIFGGEPLLSPHFPEYVEIACEVIPDAIHRGLWTSLNWPEYSHARYGAAAPLVKKLLGTSVAGVHAGFLNWNMHEESNQCEHHPQLVAIQDVIKDERRRWELINGCWLNREWSAAYALDSKGQPKFYFCEITSAFDRVMGPVLGDLGLPVEKGIWDHDLIMVPDENGILRPQGIYAPQILAGCSRCGQPVPARKGRRDLELKDDISASNLVILEQIGSPMVARKDFEVYDESKIAAYNEEANRDGYEPWRYIKTGKVRSTNVKHAPKKRATPQPQPRPKTKAKSPATPKVTVRRPPPRNKPFGQR